MSIDESNACDEAAESYMRALGGIHPMMPPVLRFNAEMRMWLDYKIALYTIVGRTKLADICRTAKEKY